MPDIEQGVDDRRADLEAAVEQHTQEAPPEPLAPEVVEAESAEPAEQETEEQQAERSRSDRDERGRFIGKPAEDKNKTAQEEPAKASVPSEVPDDSAKATKPSFERAPQSWRPAEREQWAKVPTEARQVIHRREREIEQALQSTAQAREMAGRFAQTVSPFAAMLQSEGVQDPVQAVGALLGTAYRLRTGSDTSKADMIAAMAKQFLPPGQAGIELLDRAIVAAYGMQGDGQTAPAQQQAFRDPRVDELLARVASSQTQRMEARTVAAREAIAGVENEEFFSDVRLDMADILDMAANRNLPMTPREAYNRACLMHPEISKIVERRKTAAGAALGSAQRSRNAVTPKPSNVVGPPGSRNSDGASLRDDLEAAIEQHVRSDR